MKTNFFRILLVPVMILGLQACDKKNSDPCSSCGAQEKQSCQEEFKSLSKNADLAVWAYKLQKQCGLTEEEVLVALDQVESKNSSN